MQDLDQFINRVEHLPPAPRILPELLRLLSKPDVDSDRVVRLITYDAALTAKVLQLANSAYFSGASPVASLTEAITRLGFNQIYGVVAAISGARILTSKQKGYGLNEGELWKHSVTSAVAAQLIAKELGEDCNMAFTAALLHDVGKIVLSEALERVYDELLKHVEEKQCSLLEMEKSLLGVQHAEIGGRLLARWNFPAPIVAGVWSHHDLKAAEPFEKLAAFTYLGNMIAYFLGHGYGHHPFALRGRKEALEILKLGSEDLPRFMLQTYENYSLIENLAQAGN